MKKTLQKLIPWLIAAVIFYLLFRKIPPANVLATISDSNIPLFIFYAVSYFFAIMLADCVGLRWIISRFSTQVSYMETILMRGATYLLMILNYNLAQGGMAFYLKRTHKAPVFKTLGTIFYMTLIDLTIVLTFAVIASLIEDVTYRGFYLKPFISRFAVIFYALFIIWCIFWRYTNHPIVLFLRRFKPLEWLIRRDLFVTFRESTYKDMIMTFLLRTPIMLFIVVSFFLWIHAFRSSVPLTDVLLYSPLIMVVGTLPITPAGVGTVQAFCIEFFRHNLTSPLIQQKLYTPEEILLAASLLWAISNVILKVLFGLYCLTKKSRSLFAET